MTPAPVDVPWRRYQSKPTVIEGIQWTGDNYHDVQQFGRIKVQLNLGELEVMAGANGAQGWVPVPVGHWIVGNPGDWSDLWPVDPDYFEKKYEDAPPRACRVCGCTEEDACVLADSTDGGLSTCHWIKYDVCSNCEGKS